jgi:hypothetical protein
MSDESYIDTYLVPFWRKYAEKYKDNTYVWFNIANEPGSVVNSTQRMNLHFDMHDKICNVIRNEVGAQNIIVVDAAGCGQDGCSWSKSNLKPECSTILTNGPKLMEKYDNITFSVHTYGNWEYPSKHVDFMQKCDALNISYHAGEAGYYSNQSDADWSRGFKNAVAVGMPEGKGVIWWHGQPGDGFALVKEGPIHAINDMENPTNLTWSGKIFWKAGHDDGYGWKESDLPVSVNDTKAVRADIHRRSRIHFTPGHTALVVTAPINGVYTARVVSLEGKIVAEKKTGSSRISMPLENVQAGVYCLSIYTREHCIEKHSFVLP